MYRTVALALAASTDRARRRGVHREQRKPSPSSPRGASTWCCSTFVCPAATASTRCGDYCCVTIHAQRCPPWTTPAMRSPRFPAPPATCSRAPTRRAGRRRPCHRQGRRGVRRRRGRARARALSPAASANPLPALSDREREVPSCSWPAVTPNRAVAALYVSPKTVRNHVSNILTSCKRRRCRRGHHRQGRRPPGRELSRRDTRRRGIAERAAVGGPTPLPVYLSTPNCCGGLCFSVTQCNEFGDRSVSSLAPSRRGGR